MLQCHTLSDIEKALTCNHKTSGYITYIKSMRLPLYLLNTCVHEAGANGMDK